IGAASFLHAFFSTVSANLEPKGWGSRFPSLINYLYQGHLPHTQVAAAKAELATVFDELSQLSPAAIVWEIEDRTKQPPWGNNIAPQITSLANYFVTSNGEDLFEVIVSALNEAERERRDVLIQ